MISRKDDRGEESCYDCGDDLPVDGHPFKDHQWRQIKRRLESQGISRQAKRWKKAYVWQCKQCKHAWFSRIMNDRTGKLPGSLAICRNNDGSVLIQEVEKE